MKGKVKGIRTGIWMRALSAILFLSLCVILIFCAFTGRSVSPEFPAAVIAACAFLMFLSFGRLKGAIAAAAVGAAAAIISILPAALLKEPLYRMVYRVEAAFTDRQYAGKLRPDGEINRGNIYPSDITIATIYEDSVPTETTYLKNFTGGSYHDGIWNSADDEENRIIEKIIPDDQQWAYWSRYVFRSLYLLANSELSYDYRPTNMHVMAIAGSGLQNGDVPVPYYDNSDYSSAFFGSSYAADLFIFHYLERSEITKPLDGSDEVSLENTDEESNEEINERWFIPWANRLEDSYMKELGVYTEVDTAALPSLVSWVSEHPVSSDEEAIASVLALLSEEEYTLTPGHVPYGEDPSEYFVSDSHLGYCQQFASTAVLLLRMYGIPARYAAGYRLEPSDFTEALPEDVEAVFDGNYPEDEMKVCARISEENAHAWAEIFVKNHGWVPLEVTPDSEGTVSAEIPGDGAALTFSSVHMERSSSGKGSVFKLPDFSHMLRSNASGTASSGEAESTVFSGSAVDVIIGIAAAFVLFLPCMIALLKIIEEKKISRMAEPELARLIMSRLKKRGLPGSYNGQEEDFPQKVSEITGDPDTARGEKLQRILLYLSFGKRKSSDGCREDREFLNGLLKMLNND